MQENAPAQIPAPPRSPPAILTLVELRVLEGLSRGASLPLDQPLTIGNDESSDLLLLDAGVAPSHARLWPADGGFTLALNAVPGQAGTVRQLAAGEVFMLGQAQLVCCTTDTPWDALFGPTPTSTAPPADPAPGAAAARRSKSKRMRLIGVALVLVLVLALAVLTLSGLQGNTPPPAPVAQVHHPVVDAAALAQWAHEINQRLDAAGFATLQASVEKGLMRIAGSTPGASLPRLEGLLRAARRERSDIQIVLQLREAPPEPPPLQVKAVVGGPHPRALLDNGVLLYPGERHDGVLLVAISGACLSLVHGPQQQRTQLCLDRIQQPS